MSTSGESEPIAPWSATSSVSWFLGVPLRKQTYFNLLYLLLTFPLGIAYFVFLVTGFSVGVGLIILVFGLPLLLMTLFFATQLAAGERALAELLLDVTIPVTNHDPDIGALGRLKQLCLDAGTWKGTVYLFSKFFIGIFAFVIITVLGSVVVTLLAAPLHYGNPNVGITLGSTVEFTVPELAFDGGGQSVSLDLPYSATVETGEVISTYADSVWGALVFSAIGVGIGIIVLHVFNAMAWLVARYTELMLRYTRPSLITEFQVRAGSDD
ncbi:sensor domain-containing protein [Natranaeroarchaeum aerophilus]|uniref:Sensor domain-containing protein n=1 Tax=Natranaeroarchaeum aerophilus TaxID=2917711 RepID=A0AAE3FVA5_9EURY|nr:sensor domain-containing protein [Natranaeroarchaeum aerophilus]MCL9815239.1 sensor domain-containing protein [Natranaeroarchaeum aerophilus]